MIAIKGVEMPKTCTMCWLSPMCKVHGEKPEWLGYNTRVDGCPLVEIVTCADCKWNTADEWVHCAMLAGMFGRTTDNYCSLAEKREDHETD